MPIRIFLSPRIGSGVDLGVDRASLTESTGPYRPLVDLYCYGAYEAYYTSMDHPTRAGFLVECRGDAAFFNLIEADSRNIPVLPRRATDDADLQVVLGTTLASLPLAWRNAARAKCEDLGVGTEWVTASTTLGDLVERLVRICQSVQVSCGADYNFPDAQKLFSYNLDLTVADIPVAARQQARDWLLSRGIDVSGITSSTTIRQIVSMLPSNFAKLYGRKAPLAFAGRVFLNG